MERKKATVSARFPKQKGVAVPHELALCVEGTGGFACWKVRVNSFLSTIES